MDLSDVFDFLHAAARSVGAEVTSPWFYLQLGLLMAAAGIAFAGDTAIRARVDMKTFAKGWPLRCTMRPGRAGVTCWRWQPSWRWPG
jgi:hypothetical protein